VKRVYTVTIFDREFSIKTDADENRVREIAGYLQRKYEDIKAAANSAPQPDQVVMTALDIANDFFEMRDLISDLKSHIEERSDRMITRIESSIIMEV
jgi:cell division protein ZapA (FtsZ GTPase activity inhibitor)